MDCIIKFGPKFQEINSCDCLYIKLDNKNIKTYNLLNYRFITAFLFLGEAMLPKFPIHKIR